MGNGTTDWMASPEVKFWIQCVALIAGALVSWSVQLACSRRARLILDTPTARVRSATQGYVELRGLARPADAEQLLAPLTRRRCLWYRYQVQYLEKDEDNKSLRALPRQTTDGEQGSRWVTVRQGCSDESFLVVDATGQCVIFPAGAEVSSTKQDRWTGNSEQPTTTPRRGAKRGGLRAVFRNDRYRYTEERIHDGNLLYAIGWFKTINPGDEITLAQETRQALSAVKADRFSLLRRFDEDSDGQIDHGEWEAARSAVERDVLAARAARSASGTGVHTMVEPRDRRQPFLLSTKPQRHLARHYRIASWVFGFAAVSLALFLVGLLQMQ